MLTRRLAGLILIVVAGLTEVFCMFLWFGFMYPEIQNHARISETTGLILAIVFALLTGYFFARSTEK